MEVPQSMLLDWVERIDGKFILDTEEIAKVCREIRTYATANESELKALRQSFYNRKTNDNYIKPTIAQINNWNYFEIITDNPLTQDEAAALQIKASYHPGGYGFYGFKTEQMPNGKWKNTWNCSNNCD